MELPERINKLEKERWLYLGIAALGAVTGLIGVIIAATKGGASAPATTAPSGQSSYLIVDSASKRAVRMGTTAKLGTGVMIYDNYDTRAKTVALRGFVGISADGDPVMQLYDDQGEKKRVELSMTNGSPAVQLYDAAGVARQQLVFEGLDGVLNVNGVDGKPRVKLTAKGNTGALSLIDAANKPTVYPTK